MKLNSVTSTFFIAVLITLSACSKPSLHVSDSENPLIGTETQAFVDESDTLVIIPEESDRPIVESITSAKHTIDMANFHLSNKDVVDALIRSANSGVQIRIILDNNTLHNSATAQKIVSQLVANNIQVKPSSKFFSITHQKSFVVDNQVVLISTINLVTTLAKTRDIGVFIHEKNIIDEVNAVFQADWENADNQTGITPDLSEPRLVWSPVNSLSKIENLILSSKTEIKLMVENLGSNEILNALINRSKAGVKVRVLTPGCIIAEPMRNRPFIKTLQDNNVENKVSAAVSDAEHPYIHAKMILVDGETYFIGSENFSYNSLVKARELGIISTDLENAKKLSQVYEKDWNNALAPEDVTTKDCAKVQVTSTPAPTIPTL